MIAEDESALVCDLAETYGILDHRALPAELLATLSVGLRENSRIKMKMNEITIQSDVMLMAAAVDRLSFLAWAQTKDAQKGLNKPKSIVSILNGEKTQNSDIVAFDTAEEFEAARAKILQEEI